MAASLSLQCCKRPTSTVILFRTGIRLRFFHTSESRLTYRPKDDDPNEDFFGIPEEFKLQNVRFGHWPSSSQSRSQTQSPNSQYYQSQSSASLSNLSSVSPGDSDTTSRSRSTHDGQRLSRKEKRKRSQYLQSSTLRKHFGNISFDPFEVKHETEKSNVNYGDHVTPDTDIRSRSSDTFAVAAASRANKIFQTVDNVSTPRSTPRSISVKNSNMTTDFQFNFNDPSNMSTTIGLPSTTSSRSRSTTKADDSIEKGNFIDEAYFQFGTDSSRSIKENHPFEIQSPKDIDSDSVREEHQAYLLNQHRKHYINYNKNTEPKNTSVQSAFPVSNGSFIDEHFFGNLTVSPDCEMPAKNESFSTIDEQYFEKKLESHDIGISSSELLYQKQQQNQHETNVSTRSRPIDSITSNTFKKDKSTSKSKFGEPQLNDNINNSIISNKKFLRKHARSVGSLPKPNITEPTTAYDVAVQVRKELKAEKRRNSDQEPGSAEEEGVFSCGKMLDSKGFRLLKDQVTDLSKMTSADVVALLKRKIIFNHEDFLAIDKPYGLPSFGQPDDRLSLSQLLTGFGQMLPKSYEAHDLHIVQGLDRFVTGVVILAKNPEVAYMLKGMFNEGEIIQRFWAITKGVPSPRAGILDIPLGEGKVNNAYKMIVRPQYSAGMKQIAKTSKAHSVRAVTEYKVLSSHLQAALVECQPQTNNVRHQLRVHLASGLNTPILGDHKYSHFSKMAPQKLDRTTLELLKIRQAKVRHVAMHLHCNSLVLRDYKSRMIFLKSYLPHHFSANMKSLKLSKPTK